MHFLIIISHQTDDIYNQTVQGIIKPPVMPKPHDLLGKIPFTFYKTISF